MHPRSPRVTPACRLFALALLLRPAVVAAQADSVVKVDLVTNTLDAMPPFDQAFRLRVEMPKGADSIYFRYGKACDLRAPTGARICTPPEPAIRRRGRLIEATAVDFLVDEIPPNRPYLFDFIVFGTAPAREKDPAKIDAIVSEVRDILVTAPADITDRFDSDFGVFATEHNPGPGYIGAGTNVHFYLVHVNKKERDFDRRSLRDQLFKRVSLFAGLSFVTLLAEDEVKTRYDIGNPLFGLGVTPRFRGRFEGLNFFRLNTGLVYFEQDAANPLVTDGRIKHAPFVSITGDITLKDILGPLATLLGVKT